MAKAQVLLEIGRPREEAFQAYAEGLASPFEAVHSSEAFLDKLAGYGVEVATDLPPVPMFGGKKATVSALSAFADLEEGPDLEAETVVVEAEIDAGQMDALTSEAGVQVWSNSPITFDNPCTCGGATYFDTSSDNAIFDLASSAGGVDCRPFRPGLSINVIRQLLGVERVWRDGFRGQNIVVGIVDAGVNGSVYPVVGGLSRPTANPPGSAPVTSHGSMCAADVLVAAPAAMLYDYPFIGNPRSGGALQMFQAALTERRTSGVPHVLNNSWGWYGVPEQAAEPGHEIWNIRHPIIRKVQEVCASQAVVLFAAGNCGHECPSGKCQLSSIGPGKSIHASNGLKEVITIAAVNSRHERIGYSSEGPGMYEKAKPDLAAYSHFFGNFGPDRPGGMAQPFDNGTSAATPVASGVVALLMSAFRSAKPAEIRDALVEGAINIGSPGFDYFTGHGVINAAASYAALRR